jgi:hypothetical protein
MRINTGNSGIVTGKKKFPDGLSAVFYHLPDTIQQESALAEFGYISCDDLYSLIASGFKKNNATGAHRKRCF